MPTCRHQKKSRPAKPAPKPAFTPAQLLIFFVDLLPVHALLALPALQQLRFHDRLYTVLVTLWYLLFQRLNADHTLEAVVVDARAGGANRLNPKLASGIKSEATAAYSDARHKLPWQFLAQALALQGRRIAAWSPTTLWRGRVVALLDGSTVRLRPLGDITRAFPPQGNQHQKRTYWCLMRAVVCFCTYSGAALDCALGSMHQSEQCLGAAVIRQLRGNYLIVADRNFGVFSVAQAARAALHPVLLRLTRPRAVKLLGRALTDGDHRVCWTPSRLDQFDPALGKAPIPGRLLVVHVERRGFRTLLLCLFTTVGSEAEYPTAELVRLYGLRWHIELNLRYLKTQMELVQLNVGSAGMARKEWLAGLLAYNLIRGVMLSAALLKGTTGLTLSFSSARRRLDQWLGQLGGNGRDVWAKWTALLQAVGRCRLPRRPEPRPAEPRAKRHIRETYRPLFGSRAEARRKLAEKTDKVASKS